MTTELYEPTDRPWARAGRAARLAIDAARGAGGILLERFRASRDALGAKEKDVLRHGRRDLVTEADTESERSIVVRIREAFPEDRILAEESGDVGSNDPSKPIWIIDPLDGTTNYTHGHPFFSISIARHSEGSPEIGVIYAPAIGELYWGERGGGAWRGSERLGVDDPEDFAEALLATGFSYERSEFHHGGFEVFTELLDASREVRRGGSAALDLAHTAAGIFAGFWERGLQPHDVAAGALLVREAGGVVTDFAGGDSWLHGETIACGGSKVHARLLETLRRDPQPSRTE